MEWPQAHQESNALLYIKVLFVPYWDYGNYIYFTKQKIYIETLTKVRFSALRAEMGYSVCTLTNIIIAE